MPAWKSLNRISVTVLKDYVEKSFLKYINNDGVPCSDSLETKIKN